MGDIVVVGSANADLVLAVDRAPRRGETVLGSDLATWPGGKGANQAVAAALLGADVAFVGCVGDDAHGALLRASLTAAGVDTERLRTSPDHPTGVAVITVTPDGDNAIVVSPGANAEVDERDVRAAAALLADARVVLLQLEIPLPTVIASVLAAGDGCRVVVTAAPPAALPEEVLARCDPLVVNEHEAVVLLGHPVEGDDATALLALGVRSAVLTRGAEGASVVERDGAVAHVPAPRVEAVDTTGAGDAFAGALAWRLAAGDDLVTAARWAVRVASTSVQRHGAQPSYPTAAALDTPRGGAQCPPAAHPIGSSGTTDALSRCL